MVKSSRKLTCEDKSDFNREILRINCSRAYKLSFLLILISIMLLFIIDLPNLRKGFSSVGAGYYILFNLHVILGISMFIFGGLAWYNLRFPSPKIIWRDRLFDWAFCFTLVVIGALFSVNDQRIDGEITLYILAIFGVAVINYFNPVKSLFIYLSSYIIFLLGITKLQTNTILLRGEYGNSAILIIVAWFVSSILYYSKVEEFIDKKTIDRQKVRHELSRLQAEIANLERLSLAGQMAAGIAHEIRNPMTVVKGFLQILGAKPQFESHRSTFEIMIGELERANSIISEFLSLAKPRVTKQRSQSINALLQQLYPLIEADAINQNKLVVLETQEIPDIQLDEKEISQLVLNLSRNGLEAMQEWGTLTIRTYTEDEKVVLSVQDEGGGIPTEHLDQLGTPFFTTKEDGTGLGLATCYSIVERHQAKINVESSPIGTTFYVRFPII